MTLTSGPPPSEPDGSATWPDAFAHPADAPPTAPPDWAPVLGPGGLPATPPPPPGPAPERTRRPPRQGLATALVALGVVALLVAAALVVVINRHSGATVLATTT